jgi:hypothetical protein
MSEQKLSLWGKDGIDVEIS